MERITLEQIATIAKTICSSFKIKIFREDYDEYGSECYVRVYGDCADLRIEVDDYGFNCQLICHRKQDLTSSFKYNHSGVHGGVATGHHTFYFNTKELVNDQLFKKIEDIQAWILSHAKYLTATSELFERIDVINYPDLRGSEKWANGITSYDHFLVCDEDFYTDAIIKDVGKEKLKPTESEHIDYDEILKN